MRSLLVLVLLVLSPISCVFAKVITSPPSQTTAVDKRQIFTSATFSVPSSCSTVSGLASPQPSGAVCGERADSDGTGILKSFSSGSPYVSSLAACARICLSMSTCLNVYFTQGVACNLHNTTAPRPNSASTYQYYDANCFSCTPLQTCSVVSGFATPQPAGTTCGVLSVSDGSNIIKNYTSGVFTDNAATCGDICSTTAGCTNVYCDLLLVVVVGVNRNINYHKFYPSATYNIHELYDFFSSANNNFVIHNPYIDSPVDVDLCTDKSSLSPQCTAGAITQMDYVGPYLWDNSVNPLPTSTVTTCYPPQFYSSVIGMLNNVNLPAFSALVCPYDWNTIPYNASYIACCPNGFGLIAPNYASNSARPFSAALCSSAIGLGQVYDVSSYNSTAYWTVVPETAATAGTVVFADAFDGITAPATAFAKTTSSSTKTATKTKS
ncbi:hypothetical protein N431DRAFT_554065 [Stipitochalara longipes BDJ]|nr:hypothetical protein N431DRAFT_554065 [Stipitochalara longipes BDJ]